MKNWHNSIYPKISDRILVRFDDTDIDSARQIYKAVEESKQSLSTDGTYKPLATWIFLAEDLYALEMMLPERWVKGPTQKDPFAGIPPNVWIGTAFKTQDETDERLKLLRRFRPRVLFGLAKKGHKGLTLDHHLAFWRCSNCGRRGGEERPDACPTGNLCYGEKLNPQIHWLVDEGGDSFLQKQCQIFGTAYWGADEHNMPG